MSDKKKYLDELITQIVKEEIEAVPEPPVSKEETWERICMAMDAEDKKRRTYFVGKFPKIIGGSVAVLLILVITVFSSQNASAFDWIASLFFKVEGTDTQLIGSVGKPAPSVESKPTPEVLSLDHEVRLESMTFDEAQKATNFPIILPSVIPEEFTLQDVTIQIEDGTTGNQVKTTYTKGKETFSILQTYISRHLGYSFGIDNEDTKIKDMNIEQVKGTLLTFKDGNKMLIWIHLDIQFIIEGNLSEEQMVQMAESMIKRTGS